MVLLINVIGLSACRSIFPEMKDPLPDNPIVYKRGELYTDSDFGYVTVINDYKVYIVYGEIKAKKSGDTFYAFGECLGYIEGDKTDVIYSLLGESTDEWLIEYYQGYYIEDLRPTPVVLREISTKGNDRIPDCVVSLDYDYWR